MSGQAEGFTKVAYTLGHTDYDRNIHTNTHEYTLESGQGKG